MRDVRGQLPINNEASYLPRPLDAITGITLHYTSFKAITADVDDARVYGGIHFRFEQQAGGRLGRAVATYVTKHNLRATHDHGDGHHDNENDDEHGDD